MGENDPWWLFLDDFIEGSKKQNSKPVADLPIQPPVILSIPKTPLGVDQSTLANGPARTIS